MKRKWRTLFSSGIQTKMLMIILPLIILPMLLLAAAGLIISIYEMDKTSAHYLRLQENDLRHLVKDLANADAFVAAFNLPKQTRSYGASWNIS